MRPLTTLLALPLALLPSLAFAGDLEIQVTKAVECTRKSQKGDLLSMHYKGTLLDGSKFDSSYDRGSPLKFKLGMGQVITGWDEGLLGMCIGEGRKLIIPPEMAYGDQSRGDKIPAGSTLGMHERWRCMLRTYLTTYDSLRDRTHGHRGRKGGTGETSAVYADCAGDPDTVDYG